MMYQNWYTVHIISRVCVYGGGALYQAAVVGGGCCRGIEAGRRLRGEREVVWGLGFSNYIHPSSSHVRHSAHYQVRYTPARGDTPTPALVGGSGGGGGGCGALRG